MPNEIFNWLVNFCKDRSHVTRYGGGSTSDLASINASVVPGFHTGPTAYVAGASDLKTLDPINKTSKYADDIYLIIGASKRSMLTAELQ